MDGPLSDNFKLPWPNSFQFTFLMSSGYHARTPCIPFIFYIVKSSLLTFLTNIKCTIIWRSLLLSKIDWKKVAWALTKCSVGYPLTSMILCIRTAEKKTYFPCRILWFCCTFQHHLDSWFVLRACTSTGNAAQAQGKKIIFKSIKKKCFEFLITNFCLPWPLFSAMARILHFLTFL